MDFIRNFPFFSILLSLGSGVLTSIMNKEIARLWNTFILVAITVMSAVLFVYMLGVGEPYTFMMGHFRHRGEMRSGRVCSRLVWRFFLSDYVIFIEGRTGAY